MAQSGGIEDVIGLVLLGGAAYVGWSIYQSYVAAQQAAAAAATSGGGSSSTSTGGTSTSTGTSTTSTTSTPSSSPAIVIPAGFTVTPDINDSFTGYVTYNGTPNTKFSLIFANGVATGQVFNANGSDITATLGNANVTTLTNAWNAAVQQELITGQITSGTPGMSGLGQVLVPHAVIPRRVIPIPIRIAPRRQFRRVA